MLKIKSNSLDSISFGPKKDYNTVESLRSQLNSTGTGNSGGSDPTAIVTNNHKKLVNRADSSFPSVESLHTGKQVKLTISKFLHQFKIDSFVM